MVIKDGNLKFAVLNAIYGPWYEVNKKCTYTFGQKDGNIENPVVSIDYGAPVDYRVCFSDGICFVEINNVKYRLWLVDNQKDLRLELHSTKSQLKLAKI